MEIKITTRHILTILQVISWIIFIGLCIEAGGFIFNTVFALAFNAEGAKNFWQQTDLSALYRYDTGKFLVVTVIMIIVAVMRALIFYLIIKIFLDKKQSIARPFSSEVQRFIYLVAWLALGIGLFSYSGVNYTEWLGTKGVKMPSIESLRLGGADVWLFMGVILMVIAHIFKRGIEIQTENELTV